MTSFTARHSMTSPDWYTPSCFVESARKVMGSMDLDPASDPEANQRVKATMFYSERNNGLIQPWVGNIFVNPPGGMVPQFWVWLIEQRRIGNLRQAVWIGYSLEQLQTLQNVVVELTPLDFSRCYPNQRIPFIENEAKKAERIARLLAEGEAPGASERKRQTAKLIRAGVEPRNSPSHANYISYIGDRSQAFADEFRQYGQVTVLA